jgi:hypothetical protein
MLKIKKYHFGILHKEKSGSPCRNRRHNYTKPGWAKTIAALRTAVRGNCSKWVLASVFLQMPPSRKGHQGCFSISFVAEYIKFVDKKVFFVGIFFLQEYMAQKIL